MGPGIVHYLPIVTTILAFPFAAVLVRRWQARRSGPHLLWWAAGVAMYGLGTLTEATVTLFGWSPGIFRAWYISGALLGGAPLAQGTVYLLLDRRTANRLSAVLLTAIAAASILVLLTPIDAGLAEAHRLSGDVIVWSWIRWTTPFINLYAFIFLVGGAAYSALRFRGMPEARNRVIGNGLIAIGALLPAIGGTATKMGQVEVLYVTELVGLLLIWWGFWWNTRADAPSVTVGSTPGP
jgi:hypothetical protein